MDGLVQKRSGHPFLLTLITPTEHFAILPGHAAVKGAWIIIEDHWQEHVVGRPERQCCQRVKRHPFQCAFFIARVWLAMPALDAKDKAEPALTMLAKTRPANRAT